MNFRHRLIAPSLAALLLLAALSAARAAELELPPVPGQRVFVAGHSFHIFVAAPLAEFARDAGITDHRTAGTQMIGGSRTLQHWNLPDDKNKAKAALRAGEVDVLTLSPHLLIPDEGIDNFTKLGLEKNPKLRVLVQGSWLPWDGSANPKTFTTEQHNQTSLAQLRAGQSEWDRKISAQIRALNQAIGRDAVFVVPAGTAVLALREHIATGTAPGLTRQTDLFRDPIGHATPPLQAIVCYCNYAAIYRRSPVGLPVPSFLKNLPQAAALTPLLQKLAWDALTAHPLSGVSGTVK
ncbi:hypothetical protein LBMAG56_15560 [Verrucomicrobiota bacterium]|nr:hypothetical protein LBMAG56_15560 [Verrucomicrobiota bacterium]